MIEPSEEITSMLDRGAKVQYWLMEHGYPTEYRVLTTNPQSYSLLVPDFKVIKIEPVPEPEPFIEIKKEGVD
jgi:hypothetical protein